MSERLVRASKEDVLLDPQVSPRAKKNSVEGVFAVNAIRLKVSAPPVDSRANFETELCVAELLDIPHSRISVVKGAPNRNKTVLVRGAEPDEIQRSLAELLR